MSRAEGGTAVMSSLLFLLPFLILSPTSSLEFRYHNNREIEQYLHQIEKSNPDIAHVYSIGQSVRGQQLWVLVLGLSPRSHTLGIPEFKYVANMHGNEVLGRVLLLQLVDDLVRGYRSNESWSLQLLSSTRIHVLPTMNPDGFDEAGTHCQYSQGRRQQKPDEEKREAEVRAVIGWLKTETFVLSANLHGGALVASYPYDNSNGGSEQVAGQHRPDDDVFINLAKVTPTTTAPCTGGRLRCRSDLRRRHHQRIPVVSSGRWDAGLQLRWAQCLELTLEISCCKFPPVSETSLLCTDRGRS
ncbi:unnamed protein product [Pleuronectes platessa]|uniref:Peptidase M14 domain-containing protein n=1 Tax=Pleuronectes platessa TaxID=8262 RepID=A0A9N7TT53_PLEPL|nr:unnamed protein product [Pleuronectes platessa]